MRPSETGQSGGSDRLPHHNGGTIAQSHLTYQHMVGASLAVRMLADASLVAIHCEDLDDLHLEYGDSSLVCIQVTAKATGQPALKARDPKVISTLAHFCEIEESHGSQIARYTLIASCGFHSLRQDGQNLTAVLERARDLNASDLSTDTLVRKFHDGICEAVGPNCARALPIVARKTVLVSQPSFEGAYNDLYHAVAMTLAEQEPTPDCITRIINALLHRVEQAASRRFEGPNQAYLAVFKSRDEVYSEFLAIKQIRLSDLTAIINREFSLAQDHLGNSPALTNDAFPNIRRKLTLNGGTETAIFALQLDAYHAIAEHRARQVSQGRAIASRYNDKLRAFSLHVYERIQEDLDTSGNLNARSLFQRIRSELPSELNSRRLDFPESGPEEALGALALLTEECFVPWGHLNPEIRV